jgi:hypothetical protein
MIKDRNCRYKPGSFNLGPELSMWDGSFEEIPIDSQTWPFNVIGYPYLKVPTKLVNLTSGSLQALPHDDSNGKTLTETGQLTKSLGRYLFLSLIHERAEKPRVLAPIRAPTPPLLLACCQGQLGKAPVSHVLLRIQPCDVMKSTPALTFTLEDWRCCTSFVFRTMGESFIALLHLLLIQPRYMPCRSLSCSPSRFASRFNACL